MGKKKKHKTVNYAGKIAFTAKHAETLSLNNGGVICGQSQNGGKNRTMESKNNKAVKYACEDARRLALNETAADYLEGRLQAPKTYNRTAAYNDYLKKREEDRKKAEEKLEEDRKKGKFNLELVKRAERRKKGLPEIEEIEKPVKVPTKIIYKVLPLEEEDCKYYDENMARLGIFPGQYKTIEGAEHAMQKKRLRYYKKWKNGEPVYDYDELRIEEIEVPISR